MSFNLHPIVLPGTDAAWPIDSECGSGPERTWPRRSVDDWTDKATVP